MNFLFVHQNYPGQFKHLAPALARRGHRVVAIPLRKGEEQTESGVEIAPYFADRSSSQEIHPWVTDFETKIIRADNCLRHCIKLKEKGFTPDAIIAHPGWGESLFLKEIWPEAPLGAYCEFFYAPAGTDMDFDPEFKTSTSIDDACRITLKNLNNLLHEGLMDSAISPTKWQASTFPKAVQQKITVVHDGIDTENCCPNEAAFIETQSLGRIAAGDEVITFVARNLEPYRGFHIFMRAIPHILANRPKARILIVGAEGKGYGAPPPDGTTWKKLLETELNASAPHLDWHRVSFLGTLPYAQFQRVLQVSAVHVYLTYPFVASWSLLEAMSSGAAIVGSDTPPVKEFIHDKETGVLVDFFDHRAVADAVCELLGDDPMKQRLGSAARKMMQDKYDLKSVCLPRQIQWSESLAQAK